MGLILRQIFKNRIRIIYRENKKSVCLIGVTKYAVALLNTILLEAANKTCIIVLTISLIGLNLSVLCVG